MAHSMRRDSRLGSGHHSLLIAAHTFNVNYDATSDVIFVKDELKDLSDFSHTTKVHSSPAVVLTASSSV